MACQRQQLSYDGGHGASTSLLKKFTTEVFLLVQFGLLQ